VPKLNLSWLRNLFVPFIIIAVLFVAFGAYYLYWVPNRQRHLDDRGFRYLKTLSEQIRLTINTYDKMMDHAVDAGVSNHDLPDYLKLTAPQLTVPEDSEIRHAIGKGDSGYGDPPKIDVQVDEGKHFLYLAFSFEDDKDRRVLRTDLDALVNSLLGPDTLSPFDVILVARSDGSVIFQKSPSGVEMAQINNLEDASGAVNPENPKEKKKIGAKTLAQSSTLEEVKIAGARYRLYSQPLEVGFRPAHPVANPDNPADTSWVLCGLVRADRFRSESQLIPYSYILTMLAIILLAAASYPFLKLYLSLPGERLRARDVTIAAIFTCLIAAVITFIFADVYFWVRAFGPDAQADMAKLAHAMNANFQREQQAAFVTLNALDGRLASEQVGETRDKPGNRKRTEKVKLLLGNDQGAQCEPKEACKANLLADRGLYPIVHNYPYLFFAFWSDTDGNQLVKWTTRRHATPFIPIDEASAPYYPAVRLALTYPEESSTTPTCGIGPQYSPTTGQNIISFWGVVPLSKARCGVNFASNEGEEAPAGVAGTRERGWAAIVTQPISLYNAVLPGGYQFAVLKKDGTVVFHSDTTRNLRENFLAEADLDPNLQSRVEMRSEGPVTANYMGRPHRMYVLPMDAGDQAGRWSIVIFRDLHMEEVMNLEILSLVSILFVIFAVATVLLVSIANWIWGIKSGRRWFWPDSRLSAMYRHVALVNGLSVVLLLLLSHFVSGLALLICATLIPAAVLAFNIAMAGRRKSAELARTSDEAVPLSWESNYFAAAATLVLVVAVLPCLSLFKVAANFEHRLLVENTLLKLAVDLQNRAVAMRELYREMDLRLHRADMLAGPETQLAGDLEGEKVPRPGAKPVYSYHELLSTSISNSHELIEDLPDPSAAENSLLSFLSYPYNKRAADDRHLAEGKSDVWRWTSSSFGRERTLELTRLEPGGQVRSIKAVWRPFFYAWTRVIWWLGFAGLVAFVYALTRISFSRIFQLEGGTAPPLFDHDPRLDPASLISDLPMDLLLIGHQTSPAIVELLHRDDVQVHEAEILLQGEASATQSLASPSSTMDAIISDRRPVVLRNFERLPDDAEKLAKANAALTRLISSLGNSVILVSSLDPVLVPSIEASDRWRDLLRSFVRIDLNTTPRRRLGEDDADYQGRISAESYFHWLFAGLPKLKKLVMLQLAQEKVVNPQSDEVLNELMEQGMIERKWGLLAVKDEGFAKFLKHALPHHTVRLWEKQLAGARPFSLQTSLMIVGVGVVAFLLYTQGDVFNTWVTYATGVASTVPKALQFFENFRGKPANS
jgi:hypothetical protein